MVHEVQHRNEVLNLSFCGFAFWWLIILGVHLTTCVYNLAYAKLYWEFEETMFNFVFLYHEIGISSRHNHTIAYVFMALAAVHGICALLMIAGSLWHRTLVFSLRTKLPPSLSTSSTGQGVNQHETEVSSRSARAVKFLSAAYHRVGSEYGIFGVKGRHFHVILICREVVEVVLQTNQAIRMSKYLPRLLLNRFYVSLLAINCCSSVFVYSRWFSHNEANRRFAAVVCDCILNVMTTIGITLIIMLSYASEYRIENFKWELLDNDVWVAQLLNESQVVLVVSWSDLVGRAIFPLSLVVTTTDMKALLKYSPKPNANTAKVRLNLFGSVGSEEAKLPTKEPIADTKSRENFQFVGRNSLYKGVGLQGRGSSTILQGMHVLFSLWGVIVLALHIHASKQTPLHECTPKVFPMVGALPSCYAVEFNCQALGLSATKDELESEWKRFDRSTAVRLHILHCPSLEMPDNFRYFSALQEVVVYNSTILDWGDSAAITNTHHPKLHHVALVRVNMTGGILPLGFQSREFPIHIVQICFCETNLSTLPDDLRWPTGSDIFIENSKLATIPSALAQMQPFSLALTGNPFTELPAELFEAGVEFISIGNTGINELPQNVIPTTLETLYITNTNISFFPAWIDALIGTTLEAPLVIAAGGSPYCLDLEKIMNGDSASFSGPFHPDEASILMNASEANWQLLQQFISCSPPLTATQYSLDYADELYSLAYCDEAKL